MSKKIKIGITQRVDKVESYSEWRDALDQRLIDWVGQSGFVPVPIPNTLVRVAPPNNLQPVLENWLNTVKIDAILLSGGNDIGDVEQRDLTERYLLSWAEKNRNPALGICRGMQMMGIYAGGELIQVDGHVGVEHKLQDGDKPSDIFSESVNSFHNQVLRECPENFKILAKSEDGNLEAIMHKELPWEAWMWHPERRESFLQSDLDRFKRLVKSAK
jgi:N5-(cytidine 5'-diphosphoramidyl)-L-glutamine hydrolase